MNNKNVIIIGAGISGLSAAWRLHREGIPFCLLEAGPHPGGLIGSVREDGFLTENGPTTFPAHAEALNELCRDLELSPLPTRPDARKRYLYLKGRLTALPMNPMEAAFSPMLSPMGKMRLLQEPFRPAGPADEVSLSAFMTRRIGAEATANLIDPLISGIYAGDIEQLSASAVFPALWRWEQTGGSLLRGMLKEKRERGGSPRKRTSKPGTLMSFEHGMETLVSALAKALPADCLRFGERAIQVERQPQGFCVKTESGNTYEGKGLILATPAHVSADLVQDLDPAMAGILAEIPYNSLAVAHFGFPVNALPHPLDGFGCLIPRRENLTLLGSVWCSSLFANRAPQGHVLLSNFLGGARRPEVSTWDPDRIQATALADLQTLFKTPSPPTPVYFRLRTYRRAIPQYELGHPEKIRKLEAMAASYPGLRFCGNYLNGVALNACVQSGLDAAGACRGPRTPRPGIPSLDPG